MKYLCTDSVKHLHIPKVKVYKSIFPEGELYLQIRENLKGKPVTIISNIAPTNILELLFTVDAAKRSGAKIKRIIIPFLSFARQDKVYHDGEAVAGAVICSILKNLHIPMTIINIHSERLKKYLTFKDASILPLLAKRLPKKDFIVVSPDKGGAKRAEAIAHFLKAPMLVMQKTRTRGGISIQFSADLRDRDVLIVEDMISTGTTLVKAVQLLKKAGAREIYCISAHGLFIGNARARLGKAGIKRIIVSNTFPVKPSKQIQVVSVEPLLRKS